MATKKLKKPSLTDQYYGLIRNDLPLRHKIAQAFHIEVGSVYRLAERKSIRLALPFILDIISDHTGTPKEEILKE